jgi:hypothetical protein
MFVLYGAATRDDLWLKRWSVIVIARERGRSSNHKTLMITGCPAFAGHDGEERAA